jgi:formiminotetrahydrofolate cyclodeaminase
MPVMDQSDTAMYAALRIDELCERLASDRAPGAGSAAAVGGALAASLVVKAAKRSAGSWAESAGVVAQARLHATRCLELAARGADAFDEALTALAAGADVERPLERATDVLLELCDLAADVAVLAARTAEQGDGTFRADAASAAVLAEGVARAAEALVRANLTVTASDTRLARARSLTEAAGDARRRALEAGP